MLAMQGMAADTVGAAALQLLARLAAQGVDEAAAFLQAHPAAAAGDAVGPVPPALAWRGGRRAMLLEDNSLSSGATAVYIIVSVGALCLCMLCSTMVLLHPQVQCLCSKQPACREQYVPASCACVSRCASKCLPLCSGRCCLWSSRA